MKFTLKKITGFSSTSPVVCVLRNGQPFYANSLKDNVKTIMFNLPQGGEYDIISGKITKTLKPWEYELIELPESDNIIPYTGRVEIFYRVNPNKCSVNLSDKKCTRIYFDNSFKEQPHFVVVWVVGHELGHFLYRGKEQNSEKCCDHFSANAMLLMGYNPKQIDAAISLAISNGYHAVIRKGELLENLIKIKIKN